MPKGETASEASSEHELVVAEGMVEEKKWENVFFFLIPHSACSLHSSLFPVLLHFSLNKSEKMEGIQYCSLKLRVINMINFVIKFDFKLRVINIITVAIKFDLI